MLTFRSWTERLMLTSNSRRILQAAESLLLKTCFIWHNKLITGFCVYIAVEPCLIARVENEWLAILYTTYTWQFATCGQVYRMHEACSTNNCALYNSMFLLVLLLFFFFFLLCFFFLFYTSAYSSFSISCSSSSLSSPFLFTSFSSSSCSWASSPPILLLLLLPLLQSINSLSCRIYSSNVNYTVLLCPL